MCIYHLLFCPVSLENFQRIHLNVLYFELLIVEKQHLNLVKIKINIDSGRIAIVAYHVLRFDLGEGPLMHGFHPQNTAQTPPTLFSKPVKRKVIASYSIPLTKSSNHAWHANGPSNQLLPSPTTTNVLPPSSYLYSCQYRDRKDDQ